MSSTHPPPPDQSSLIQTILLPHVQSKKIAISNPVRLFATGKDYLFIRTSNELLVFGNNAYNSMGLDDFDSEHLHQMNQSHREALEARNRDFLDGTKDPTEELDSMQNYFNASFRAEDDDNDNLLEGDPTDSLSDDSSVTTSDEDPTQHPLPLENIFNNHSTPPYYFKELHPWNGPIDPKTITNIVCGAYHSVFIVDMGTEVYVCGRNDRFQCGLEHNHSIANLGLQKLTAFRNPVKLVACGHSHTIFCTYKNQIAVCGATGLSDLPDRQRLTFIRFPWIVDREVKQIAASGSCSLILFEDGELYAFGRLNKPSDSHYIHLRVPTRIDLGQEYVPQGIACGACHAFVLAHHALDSSRRKLFVAGEPINVNGSMLWSVAHDRMRHSAPMFESNPELPSTHLASPQTPQKSLRGDVSTIMSDADPNETMHGNLSPFPTSSPRDEGNDYNPLFSPDSPHSSQRLLSPSLQRERSPLYDRFVPLPLILTPQELLLDIKSSECLAVLRTTHRLIPLGASLESAYFPVEIPLKSRTHIVQFGCMDTGVVLRVEEALKTDVPPQFNEFRLKYPHRCDVTFEFSCYDLEVRMYERVDSTRFEQKIVSSLLSPSTQKLIKKAAGKKGSKKGASKAKKSGAKKGSKKTAGKKKK